jgi:hypothetical protein
VNKSCTPLLALLTLFFALPSIAGQRCDPHLATPDATRLAAAAAARTVAELDSHQRPIALLARIGQDLSAQGLLYSHAAFVVRDDTASDARGWRVTHLLNDCGTDHGALFREGVVDFYLDNPLSYQAKLVFVTPALETVLLRALNDHHGKAVFERRYSVIAKPYSKTRQNSTGWMLEVIAAASGESPDSRAEAMIILSRRQYQPDIIHIPYSQRILGGLTRANAVFTDHSLATRLSGKYPVSTVHSVFRYLRENMLTASEVVLVPIAQAELAGE